MNSDVELYLKNTFELARSMVIKSFDSATLINKHINKLYGIGTVDELDPTTWKYYLNLSGEYYSVSVGNVDIPVDTPMFIKSLDTGNTISFDKTTLASHPTTVFSYKRDRTKVTNMLLEYPEQESLIKSILYPVDINEAINAKDYSILTYDKDLVEINETTLIDRLQTWIYSYAERWSIRPYILIDDLYLASQLSVLYLNLVPKILNIRLGECLTDRTHSFHIHRHLESHTGLDIDVSLLDLDLKLWLYKNISYLQRNTGSQDTLETIVERFFINRNLSVNKYVVTNTTGSSLKDTLKTPDITFKKIPLLDKLKALSIDTSDEVSVVLENETSLIKDGGYKGLTTLVKEKTSIVKSLALNKTSESGTKILETVDNNIGDILPIDNNRLIIDNWISSVMNHNYNAGVEYLDPETNVSYLINQKQAILIFVNYISKYFGLTEAKVPTWVLNIGYRSGLTLNSLNSYTNRSDNFNQLFLDYMSTVPDISTITNTNEFKTFLDNLIPGFRNMWLETYSVNDYIDVGAYKNTIDYMFKRQEVSLGNNSNTIEQELSSSNINLFNNKNHNYVLSLKALLLTCTGYEIDVFFLLSTITDVPMDFFDELTSYSIKNLSGRNINAGRSKYYLNNSMLRSTKKPLKHIYSPRLTINWGTDTSEYIFINNVCNQDLLAQGACEVKNYVTSTPIDTPPGGLITLSPMLDIVSADNRRPLLLARTTEYETILV